MKAQLHKAGQTVTNCPGQPLEAKCSQTFSDWTVKEMLSDQRFAKVCEEINEVLLQKYIVQTPELVQCPKQGCNYAGFVDPNMVCT